MTFSKISAEGDITTETTIYHDGIDVGYIWKVNRDASASRGWYPRWMASSYEVVFLIGQDSSLDYDNDNIEDKCFEVDDYGHPRTALAAAKRYARETLNRESA